MLKPADVMAVAEGAVGIIDVVGGPMAFDGVRAAEPSYPPVTVGRWLAEFDQEIGRGVGRQVLKQPFLVLLQDLGGPSGRP